MRVFVSWSGEKSRAVALALRDWLPRVINEVEPFVSAEDIAAGAVWQAEIAGQLESARFGIVCITAENQDSRWLNFEAGAVAKQFGRNRVVPLAIDLTEVDVKPPLGQYQAKGISKSDILEVLQSLNEACDRPLAEDLLRDSHNQWWGRLESELKEIEANHPTGPSEGGSERSTRDLLEEILTTVRALQGYAEPPSRTLQYLAKTLAGTTEWRDRGKRIVALLQPLVPDARIVVPAEATQSVLIVSDEELPEETQRAVLEVSGAQRFAVDFIFAR
jgi:hypothetical protein